MSLSVCLITADPAGRIATILEPLRAHADEIVIAADARVDEQTLAGYGALADKLFRIEFAMAERHLMWLCEQCSCEWILRLDGDEVPSAAFVRQLPDMLAARQVHQFWSAQAWVYPDAERFLTSMPWADDFHVRLIRNDGLLRCRGIQHMHIEPVSPREYVEAPFYHLDLLLADEQERREKAIRYEVARPRLMAEGGGRINEAFYLPELRDSLQLSPVPVEDRALIACALAASDGPDTGESEPVVPPVVSLETMDRSWEGRRVADTAYSAVIEPRDRALQLAPSEHRHVFVAVTNQGTERWPGDLKEGPAIRLACRWLDAEQDTEPQEGPRSPFSRRLRPGERILTPLQVHAPAAPGEYVLEVDVVHEDVRWFGCACRIPVRVQEPSSPPAAAGAPLRERTAPRRRHWRPMRIPKTIHRIWLGEKPMPEEQVRFGKTFADRHPGWEMRLWTDEHLPQLGITEAEGQRARSPSELSNLVRYEVLHRLGGVYVDTDMECLRCLTPLLRGVRAFAALELADRAAVGILGSVAGHPLFERAARLSRRTLGLGTQSPDANGPYFFSLLLEQDPSVALFGPELFYPYHWDEPQRRHEAFPDAYTVHHWARSWR